MSVLPRLALATPKGESEPAFASLAMLAGLAKLGWRVQHFRCCATPLPAELIRHVTGLPGRHLDSWLMGSDVCRQVFWRGSVASDLAFVEGSLDSTASDANAPPFVQPGPLAPMVEALELPVVALISRSGVHPDHLPLLPATCHGVLIDEVESAEEFASLKRMIELLQRTPVLGAVERLPECRRGLTESGSVDILPPEMLNRLEDSFLKFADLTAIRRLACCRHFGEFATSPPCARRTGRFRVAYAQDDAFGRYFPDTLETLEALGAELVEFSPICDESLPEHCDLVMVGCGYPDRHCDELAANHSLIAALRAHVCNGRRIYSEGGGTAYLGRTMNIRGRVVRGADILPIDSTLREDPLCAYAVTRTLLRDCWLGCAGTVVRGYCSNRWQLRPATEPDDCPARSGALTDAGDFVFRHHAVGSLIHLHLASLPEVVRAFAGPHWPALATNRRDR